MYNLWNFIWNNMILILLVKDPCKKCLVRACCSQRCEEKTYYLNFCDIEGKTGFRKFIAVITIYNCIFIVCILFWTIILNN